jgi:hypothetical protein
VGEADLDAVPGPASGLRPLDDDGAARVVQKLIEA